MNHTVYIVDFSDYHNPKLTTTNVRYLPKGNKRLKAYFIAPGSIKADWIACGNRAYINHILSTWTVVGELPFSDRRIYWSLSPVHLIDAIADAHWCTRSQLAALFPDHPELSI